MMTEQGDSPSNPGKPKFSIDSILQRKTEQPGSSAWLHSRPRAQPQPQSQAVLQQLQQQKAAIHCYRSNQYLVQFLLNAGFTPPFRSLVALNSRQTFNSSSNASAGAAASLPAGPFTITPTPITPPTPTAGLRPGAGLRPAPGLRPGLQRAVARPSYREQQQQLANNPPPGQSSQDISDSVASPRKREDSWNSNTDTATSEEENANSISCNLSNEQSLSLLASTPSPKPKGGARHHKEMMVFKKSRTSFTKSQLQKLEAKFGEQKYLTKLDRTHMASDLGLTEKHVKTWFQNRRTKWKRDCSDVDWSKHKELAATLMYGQYLENKTDKKD